jgi:hypothetical protein
MVRKVRRLPLPGSTLVKVGDKVDPETRVAKISLKPGIPWVVPVARQIGMEPAQLAQCMLVKVGDRVQQKQVIARGTESGLYGRKEYEAPIAGVIEDISLLSGRVVIREEFGKEEPPLSYDAAFELNCKPKELGKYMLKKGGDEVKKGQIIGKKGEAAAYLTPTTLAPISGKIAEINEQTGFITIARPFEEVVVKAYIAGKVVEILPDRGAVVETPAITISGIFGVGGETHGELKVVVDRHDSILDEDRITADLKDRIIVGGAFATNAAVKKALSVGVKGLITGTASYLNLVQSLGCKLGVGITGQEDVNMTVILMEGFGNLAMREEVFATFKAVDGMFVSINGATQIRAGAIRPEVIVPLAGWAGEIGEAPVVDEELSPGLRVRIINKPYFGEVGHVKELPREPQMIETEAKAPVVIITLDDGRDVTVPRQNVEVL